MKVRNSFVMCALGAIVWIGILGGGIGAGIGVVASRALADEPANWMAPAKLAVADREQLMMFRPSGGATNMLGVLDVDTFGESADQSLFPWYHDTEILPQPGGFEWVLSADDKFIPFDADGDGTDEVLAYNGMSEIAILDTVPGSVRLEVAWTSGRVLDGPAGSWTLGWRGGTDVFTPIDLDGNGDDELLILGNYPSDSKTWFGVLDYRGGRMKLVYVETGGGFAEVDGVPIPLDSTFQAMNVRGNAREEIVARLPVDPWTFRLAVFRVAGRSLVTEFVSDDDSLETTYGGAPWGLAAIDSILPIDVDGDGIDEMLSVARDSHRLGFAKLRTSDSQVVVFAEMPSDGQSVTIRGAGGEADLVADLGRPVRFLPVDLDGDGVDEIAYFQGHSSDQTFGVCMFLGGELRHVWSTPYDGIAGPNGEISLDSDSTIYAANVDGGAKEEVVIFEYDRGEPNVHVFRASASGMSASFSENMGPLGRWTMEAIYDAPSRDFPAWGTPGQRDAYDFMSRRIVGSSDIRSEYTLDTATPETWLAILAGLSKPAGIPQSDWNATRRALGDELQALAKVIVIFARMQDLHGYTEDAMQADANHVEQQLRSAIDVTPAGTGISMSPLAWASQFVGVAGGALGNPATATIQFALTIIDGLTEPPANVPLSPGSILLDYKITLLEDLVRVRQETEARERVIRGDWGKLTTFGSRYRGIEIGDLPGRSEEHTQELYRTVLIELYTINYNPGFLKGSSWDPTRHTPSYFTYDFDREDPYAIRVGLVRKPAYRDLISFPSEAVRNELDIPSVIGFYWGWNPWYWEGGQYPPLP